MLLHSVSGSNLVETWRVTAVTFTGEHIITGRRHVYIYIQLTVHVSVHFNIWTQYIFWKSTQDFINHTNLLEYIFEMTEFVLFLVFFTDSSLDMLQIFIGMTFSRFRTNTYHKVNNFFFFTFVLSNREWENCIELDLEYKQI
jgi:hypothetical protein